MKILVTSIVDLKKSQHNRPHQFVKYLSKHHDITVLSINDWWKGNQGDLNSYSSDFNDIFKGVDFHYLTERKVPPILQEVLFTKKNKELCRENFDVHLNYNCLVTGYRASKNFKTVFDLADDLPEMIATSPQVPNILKPFGKSLGNFFLNKDIKYADHVTVTTESLKETYKIPDAQAELIPNGVDTNIFKNDPKAKEELGLNGFIVGYVGVLRGWVDFKPVFEALKCLDNEIKLLIVGSEGRFQENKELAKKCGVADRVIFTGMIPYSLVPKYVSAMDVGIIPFRLNEVSQNALPIKLFEYFACEKPVISSEIVPVKSSFPEDVLFASNCEDYVDKIAMLYEDKGLRRKLGKNGRKISEKHNWKNITAKLEKTLIRVA
ncbi:MAG: glycosyltransferase [Methanobacterium paludis]|nr:glycosyltransferase [Methanobacterium paludis]